MQVARLRITFEIMNKFVSFCNPQSKNHLRVAGCGHENLQLFFINFLISAIRIAGCETADSKIKELLIEILSVIHNAGCGNVEPKNEILLTKNLCNP